MKIPAEFHSFKSDGPFTHCLECGRYLLDDDFEYVIEKAVRNYPGYTAKDVIFDYAICMNCAMEVQKGISEESMSKIQNYMQNKLAEKDQEPKEVISVKEQISKCMISDKSVDDCTEYQIFAFCRGTQLSNQMPPYMISDEILDEIQELISDETRDELNGFYNKHFPTAPHESQPDPRLILI